MHYRSVQRPLTGNYANSFGDSLEAAAPDEPCYGRRCSANEYCCPGSVCVDVDGGELDAGMPNEISNDLQQPIFQTFIVTSDRNNEKSVIRNIYFSTNAMSNNENFK